MKPKAKFGKDIKLLIKRHNKYEINNYKVISFPNYKHEIIFDILNNKVKKISEKFIEKILLF